MNETLIQLLQYGGLPALGIGIIYFLYRAILGLEIFPRLTRKQSFIIILTVILSTVLVIIVLVLYGNSNNTENPTPVPTESNTDAPKKKKITYGGQVVDSDGQPLIGAVLSFRYNDSIIEAIDPTDNYGNFHFEFQGTETSFKAQLRVKHENYDDLYRRNVQIIDDKHDELIRVSLASNGTENQDITYFKIYGLDDDTRNKLEEAIIAINDQFQTSPSGIKVEFRHSSGIKTLNGSYSYLKGNVVINVNGKVCRNLSTMKIDKYSASNQGITPFQKKLIVKSLQSTISKKVNTYNIDGLAESIVSCLR